MNDQATEIKLGSGITIYVGTDHVMIRAEPSRSDRAVNALVCDDQRLVKAMQSLQQDCLSR